VVNLPSWSTTPSDTDIDTSSLISQNDQVTELQGITVDIKDIKFSMYNVYVPPASVNARFSLDIRKLLAVDDNTMLLLGDLNAHVRTWFSNLSNNHGESLASQIENSDLFILNQDIPTRCPSNGNNSSLDISLISCHLALLVTWATFNALNLDHLPIAISFDDDQPLPCTACKRQES
jgi:hypothetical protein